MIRSGREVSRIEGFSDAVFGFALTLLVVSLEVPEDFEALKQTLRGFIPFGATFALVCWIWYEHYAFFRKFDAEDNLTIALNCLLLFLVLFFVYPLKFVFSNIMPSLLGRGPRVMSESDARLMFVVYSGGFVAMMLVFVLMYRNQYRRREEFQLTAEQIFEARTGTRTHLVSLGVGVLSIVLALTLPVQWLWMAGPIYTLQGPLQWLNGRITARERARTLPSSMPARP
jgi:uncharacterized membrane protein